MTLFKRVSCILTSSDPILSIGFVYFTLYIPHKSTLTDPVYSLPTFCWMWFHSAMILIQFVVCIPKFTFAPTAWRAFCSWSLINSLEKISSVKNNCCWAIYWKVFILYINNFTVLLIIVHLQDEHKTRNGVNIINKEYLTWPMGPI